MARPGRWTAAHCARSAIDRHQAHAVAMAIRMTRYQWLLVALLSANFGVVFFDRNAFSYLAAFIQPDLNLSNFQIGNIASAFSFSWAIAGLCIGSLVDRFGRRKMILVAATLG